MGRAVRELDRNKRRVVLREGRETELLRDTGDGDGW